VVLRQVVFLTLAGRDA